MTTLDQSPFVWLEFDKAGALVDPHAIEALRQVLETAQATDLVVLSHGWKNDRVAALNLYRPLWENTRAALTSRDARRIVVAGVLWPSVPYRTNFDEAALREAAAQGGLASHTGGTVEDIDGTVLKASITDFLGDAADGDFEALALAAAEDLSSDEAARLVDAALARLSATGSDPELQADLNPITQRTHDDPKGLLLSLAARPPMSVEATAGGGLGVDDDIKAVFAGARAAVARLLGQLSFFEMKTRAGVVGAELGALLTERQRGSTVRLHLVGHSFGARLVTAAANAMLSQDGKVASLTLLQGAFSHNALASDFEGRPGAFAAVATGGVGVIAITHTQNDRACGLAYALASRISRDVASAVGDASDRFGAMGANGAQNVAVVAHGVTPGDPGAQPRPGKINNYHADAYIRGVPPGTDAHGDVKSVTIGKLLASVLEA